MRKIMIRITSIQAEQELFWIAGKQEIVIRDNRNDSDEICVPCKIESKYDK